VVTQVSITVDLATLVGLSDVPATVSGDGPGAPSLVDAGEIRALLAEGRATTLRRLVTEPLTGRLIDRGRTAYRVSEPLRAFLTERDQTCRFPGCQRPAHRGQIDHAIPWDEGGPTDRSNLGVLCTRHHQLKTHAGWRILSSSSDGSCRWQAPSGLTYEHAPPASVDPSASSCAPHASARGAFPAEPKNPTAKGPHRDLGCADEYLPL
jgi:HNH endonuclease